MPVNDDFYTHYFHTGRRHKAMNVSLYACVAVNMRPFRLMETGNNNNHYEKKTHFHTTTKMERRAEIHWEYD